MYLAVRLGTLRYLDTQFVLVSLENWLNAKDGCDTVTHDFCRL